MIWLRWPYFPLRFTAEWDALEAVLVTLLCVLVFASLLVAVRRASGYGQWMWLGGVTVVLAMVAQQWAETMCFARVSSPPHITEIEVLPPGSMQRFWELKESGVPVVLRGALNASVDLHEWGPEFLATELGTHHVQVQLGNVEQNATELFDLPFGQFLEGIRDAEWLKAHAKDGGKLPYFAESEDLFDTPRLAYRSRGLLQALGLDRIGALHYQTLFWIGPAGALTGLHMDMDALNLLFQVHGTKRFWIYPISQSELVYPSTKYDLGASLAQVDHFAPDLDKYPRFAKATPLEVVVYPGDVAFIPSFWYHAARSDTVSVSVSVRLFSVCEALAVAPLTVLDVLHNWGLYRADDCVCHSPSGGPY